jgi:Ca2+-binding RTX toxin-like protein
VIYGKSGDDIYITGGTHAVYLLGSDGSITATAGTNTMYTNGTRNVLTGGTGVEKIQAFAGGNTLKGGGGNDTIYFGGSGNVVYTGDDNDVLNSSGTNSRIVFGKAGEGVTDIYGYVLKNGDTLDLRTTLENTSWNGDTTKLANFIKISTVSNDAVISINTTGVAGATTHKLAVLHDAGTVSLSTLLAHSLAA